MSVHANNGRLLSMMLGYILFSTGVFVNVFNLVLNVRSIINKRGASGVWIISVLFYTPAVFFSPTPLFYSKSIDALVAVGLIAGLEFLTPIIFKAIHSNRSQNSSL